ncbi:hypothetical protein WDU94_002447, partial [Cyamophila willieti]
MRRQTAFVYKSPVTLNLLTLTSFTILVKTSGASFNNIQHRVQSESSINNIESRVGSEPEQFEFSVHQYEVNSKDTFFKNRAKKTRDHLGEGSIKDVQDDIILKVRHNHGSVNDKSDAAGDIPPRVHQTQGSVNNSFESSRTEGSVKENDVKQESFQSKVHPEGEGYFKDGPQQGPFQNRVHLRAARVGFRTHPNFLSFAIDASHVDEGLTKMHLTDPRLIALTTYLSPAYLRVGGIAADRLLFKLNHSEEHIKADGLKPSSTNQKEKPKKTKFFTGSDWLALHKFARLTNTRLVFDLNVLIRMNTSQESDVWNSTNFMELMAFSEKYALRNDWQLGNEPNAYKHQAGRPLLPDQLARDFRTLNDMLRQSLFHRNSLLIGPDITRPLKTHHCPRKDTSQSIFNNGNIALNESRSSRTGINLKSSTSPNEFSSACTEKQNCPENISNEEERKELNNQNDSADENEISATDFKYRSNSPPNVFPSTCTDYAYDDRVDPLDGDYIPPEQYLDRFLASGGSDVVSAVSFHQYYLNLNSSFSSYLSPDTFELLRWQINTIQEIVNHRFANHVQMPPIWLGETGSCVGGGVRNLTDTFAASFLWLDKLGLSARLGISVVIRQSLEFGNYSLTDVDTLTPNPDWWISVIYKRLVDNRVLTFSVPNSRPTLRLYAHCSPRNNITVFGLNSGDQMERLYFAEPCTVYVYKLKQCPNENITSRNLCLYHRP